MHIQKKHHLKGRNPLLLHNKTEKLRNEEREKHPLLIVPDTIHFCDSRGKPMRLKTLQQNLKTHLNKKGVKIKVLCSHEKTDQKGSLPERMVLNTEPF